MKMVISFAHNGKDYKYTIDEKDVDMSHYDDFWDYWMGENENELLPTDKEEDEELVFEVNADKKFIGEKAIICDDNIRILVYENLDTDNPCDTIEKIEVMFA